MIGLGIKSVISLATQSIFKTCANSITTQPSLKLNSLNHIKPLWPTSLSNLAGQYLFKSQPVVTTQTRNSWGYKGRMMLKDIKRRELVRKYGPVRVRLQTLKSNSILPKVLRKQADEELSKLTRHSFITFVRDRCAFTSKAASCLTRWRLSRHVWRDITDYNHMSGVQRATWGKPTRNAVHFVFKKSKRSWLHYDGNRLVSFLDRQGQQQKLRFKLG